MKNELLSLIRRSLVEIVSIGDDHRALQRMQELAKRLTALGRRLRLAAKWQQELDACSTVGEGRESIARIIAEIDQLVKPSQPLVLSYLRQALSAGDRDLVETLDSAVKSGTALMKDPPFEKEVEEIAADLVLCVTVVGGESSTEKLLNGYEATFQTIVYEGLPRPKLWILPTRNRKKVVVAMGRADVVERLLKPVFYENSFLT